MGKEIQKKVGKILVSPPKMGIMVVLSENSVPFTTIKNQLELSSGSLNYHLLVLEKENLLVKNDDGKYLLTDQGNKILKIIRNVVLYEKQMKEK